MPRLMTSRFSRETMAENREYAKKLGVKCIYASPSPITNEIPANEIMFVLEMNNSTNSVDAIGMARNTGSYNEHIIYHDKRYNVFTYTGRARITRAEMVEDEECIMKALDILCMTGAYHLKRSTHLTQFPTAMLKRCLRDTRVNLTQEIEEMFRRRANNGK